MECSSVTHITAFLTKQLTPSHLPAEGLPLALDENQLARRWNVSVKTLRRWRSEHIGPTYCKLGQRTTYLLGDIEAFERRVARNPCSVSSGDRGHA